MRVLVLVNENSPVYPALLFLRKHGYKIKVVHKLMETVKELSESNPDVLLISWNLKKVDVKKAYTLLSQKFDSICIVFGEENNNKTSTALMASGIANTLLPPVSGPGIHMRIQALAKKKSQWSNSKDFNRRVELAAMTTIDPVDIPGNTRWEKVEGENRWKGTSEVGDEKNFYFFDGDKMPVFNPHKKQWEGFGKVNVRTTKAPSGPKQMKIQFNADLKEPGEDMLVSKKELESALNLPKKKNQKVETEEEIEAAFEAITVLKPKGEKTSLARGMKKAVAHSIVPGSAADPVLIQIQTKITVTTLKTSKFQGYIVGAHANDIPDKELMEQVLKNLGVTMQDLGEPLSYKTQVLALEVDPIPFMLWVDSKAEFFVKSRHHDHEVAYAYLPFINMPETVAAEDNDELLGIKLSSINPGKPVPFDFYIYMPKNNKYLLYSKDKSVVTAKVISKLIKFGIKHIYIKKTDVDAYHTYCAKYKIAEAYEDFKKVG